MREDIKERIDIVNSGAEPDGYVSAFGLTPITWKEYPLKAIAKKVNMKNRDNAVSTVLSNTAMHGVIRQTDYFDKDIANEDNMDGYFVVNEKDFVYNPRISSMAPYGPIHANELGIKGIVSPLYTVFRLNNSDKYEYDFLRYYFDSSQWYKYMYTVANYGARHDRMNISGNDFFALPVALPPIKEQKKIVKILNRCDKVIELKQQLIEEECNRKKWLMQNLLNPDSGVRLPNFFGEWLQIPFGKVGAFSKGTGISNDDCKTGDFPCIKYGDIYMSYDESFAVPVSYTTAEIAALSPKVINGALLFTASGEDRLEIGKCTAYLGNDSLAVGGDIVICTPNEKKYDSLFLAYQQNAEALIKQKSVLSQGYSIVHLYSEQVKKLKIRVPPTKEEQVAISALLLTIDNKVWLLRQELAQWQQKKKALMQILLTGIVRVSV